MTLRRRIQSTQTYLAQRQEALRFDRVDDPRDPRGQRWRLSALLSSALLGMVLLARSLRRAEQLSEDLAGARLLRQLGLHRRVPDSTLGEALSRVAPSELLAQLHHQVLAEHRRKALRPVRLPVGVIAIDGKTQAVLEEPADPFFSQRQSRADEPGRYVHRVLNATLISAQAAICIHQMPIPAVTNEMGFFPAFFDGLVKAYRRADLFEVVTSDAGVIGREHGAWLDEQGFGYVVALKDNNPDLELEARGLLQSLAEEEPPVASEPFELDSSRGWVKRQLWVSSELRGWPGWEHLRQVLLVRVWAKKTKNGPVEHLEDRLYVTNLTAAHRLRGKKLLALVRGHWRIENELHGTLDLELREDDPWWVRRGYGLINTGLLRIIAYNLLAIARLIHLRRDIPPSWKQIRDWLRDAIIWPIDETDPAHEALEPADAAPA
jgi:hypothetical protein